MDPGVKKYFRKIINSFSAGLLWMMAAATAGFYFKLAPIYDGVKWYNVLFYALLAASFGALLFYLYRVWGKKED